MRLPLPSELIGAAGAGEIVVAHPSSAHAERSATALSSVAAAMAAATPGSAPLRPLDVVVSHVDHQGLLSTRLYTFHLVPVHEDGTLGDSFEDGVPLRFMAVLNQPVAVQVESLITSVSELVARQVHIARIRTGEADVADIDRKMIEMDDVAQNQVVDVLRHGWQAAAEMVTRQAAAAGFALRLVYEPAAAPTRESVVRRAASLRRCYNVLPVAREAVDRFVSAIAPRGQIVAPPEVPEAIRAWTQQQMALGSLHHYVAEAMRDAAVTGNGYLAFKAVEPFGAYNLHPDEAVDLDGGMAASAVGQPAVPALHLRGLEQPGCAYGLGALELALPFLQQFDVFEESTTAAQRVLATASLADHREWATSTLRLAERAGAAAEQKLRQVFAPMFEFLPEPVANLYFEGRERL